MKTASVQLAAHLAGGVTTLATCWKVTRRDGTIFGFTDFDDDIVFDSLTYVARTGYTRSAVSAKSDNSVDNLDLEAAFDSTAITADDLRAGIWDGAEVLIFLVNWADLTQGNIILKRGTIGAVDIKDSDFTAELRGLTQALSQKIVEVYTPDCRADLGDTRCKVSLTALAQTGTVTSVTSRRVFADTARTEADGYWNYGLITWTSGENIGRKMEVRNFTDADSSTDATLTLFLAMPDDIAVGDAYSVTPGCDKTFATCKAKFNNVNNFRGEPYIPGTDAVYKYPDAT